MTDPAAVSTQLGDEKAKGPMAPLSGGLTGERGSAVLGVFLAGSRAVPRPATALVTSAALQLAALVTDRGSGMCKAGHRGPMPPERHEKHGQMWATAQSKRAILTLQLLTLRKADPAATYGFTLPRNGALLAEAPPRFAWQADHSPAQGLRLSTPDTG
ncbi:hypothetical protein TREES_T100021862 [Tupaia chinensis]|uniref:Uncharacterized protein n=1 Tax=Tupaia chinensis TaxID=246437 RepID=L9JBA0_TUPCH|nr:hypothetical protein TREES_T100021862 [Tupaia chinensis]